MKIYKYHPTTKEYTGEKNARVDPLESIKKGEDVFLIPACATDSAPPATGQQEVACFQDGAWVAREDSRGVSYWVDYKAFKITSLGEKIPDGAVLVDPGKKPKKPKTQAEIIDESNQAVTRNCKDIDYICVGLMRDFLIDKYGGEDNVLLDNIVTNKNLYTTEKAKLE